MREIKGIHFKCGLQVEVNLKGLTNLFFKATIISGPKFNKSRNMGFWVEYETIFDHKDPSKKLQEFTHISFIRPLPPTRFTDGYNFFKFGFVEAYHKDGWFTGVLLHVFDNGLKYLVAFLDPYEDFMFGKDQIRVHLEWVFGGRWRIVYGSHKVRDNWEVGGKSRFSTRQKVAFCLPKVAVGENIVASLPESTPAVDSSVEQESTPAKKVKRRRTSSDSNYVVQSVHAPQKVLQPCSLPPSKGDTHCNGKSKASDGQNYSPLPFSPQSVDIIKKKDDSHSRSPAKGNQVTEVVDLTNEPKEVPDEQVLVKATLPPRKSIGESSGDTLLYQKVGKSGLAPPSYVLCSSSRTFGSPNPLTSKGTSRETPGTKLPEGAPDAPDRFSGSFLLDRMKKHSLLNKTSSSPQAVLTSQSENVASLLESTFAVVNPVEQPPSPAKNLKRTTSGDAEEKQSSHQNYDVQCVDAPQKFIQPCPLTSNKGNAHCDGKRKASDGQNYPSLSFSPNNNACFCPPNGSETVIASLLELTPVLVSPVEQAPSPAKKVKRTNSTILSLLAKDQGNKKNDAHSPAKGNEVTQVVDTINEPEKVIDAQDSQTRSPAKGNQVTKVVDVINKQVKVKIQQGDCGSKAPILSSEPAATQCPKAQSDMSQSWPFTKKSEMWKIIESMEVFERIPQAPHFSPLNEHEENSREKLALCLMTKLSYEAERISSGSPDDLNSSRNILDTLKSLEEFESHGFNISPLQDYLTELLLKMEKEKELHRELAEIESGIVKCQDEKAASERKVSELGKQLKSVQEQIQSEKSVKYVKDRQRANLESDRSILSRKLHSLQLTMKPAFEW